MQKQNLNELIEYDDERFHLKVLINQPGYRMVLVSMRQGQSIPEHAAAGMVTVYATRGHVTLYEGSSSCELHTGEVVLIENGSRHRIDAGEDSVLLFLITRPDDSAPEDSKELDLRQIPGPQRHPLVFQTFDALAVGDSMRLINDHDPVPLSRQIASLRPGEAAWEYIERGPNVFRIRILRVALPGFSQVPGNEPPANPLIGIDDKK